jgi:tRNA(His) 5'-end guanylyltransferase
MKDELGDRIKTYYEDALRVRLPRRTHIVLRIDGRSFHQFTRGFERPYCRPLADALDAAALAVCREAMGARFAYGQSDEYSFLLTDLESEKSPLWFDGNLQKIVSVAASLFTAAFGRAFASEKLATFDCRALVIGRPEEVEKYFIWRQLDASANSLNMLAAAHYSHAELLGKSEAEKHDLLHAKGLNWAKEPADFKRGRAVRRNDAGDWIVDREIPIFQRDVSFLRGILRMD